MPVQEWETKDVFDQFYDIAAPGWFPSGEGAPPKPRLNYQRAARADRLAETWDRILAYDWDPPNGVLITPATCPYIGIVGCGFGWSIGHLLTKGWGTDPTLGPAVWGAETSAYIQDNKDVVDPFDGLPFSDAAVSQVIAAESLANTGSRNRWVRDATDDNGFNLVVSEDVVTSLPDGEATTLRGAMNSVLTVPGQRASGQLYLLLHLTSYNPREPAPFNWKTHQAWWDHFSGNDAVGEVDADFILPPTTSPLEP
jgi:hypothetical protein